MIAYFREHGITWDMAVKYRLGYVAHPLRGDERFAGRISVPYLTSSGVVAVNYRGLNGATPKYLKPHGQKARLFNTAAYFQAGDTIGVSEGEMDAIAATEHLGVPTVGVPGSTNFSKLWLPLFKDFTRVLIFADGDDAGDGFAAELAELIGWRAQIARCPSGEDVSSVCAAGRSDVLRRATLVDA